MSKVVIRIGNAARDGMLTPAFAVDIEERKNADANHIRGRAGKIDNMCDGDMCKFFETTHHCSACRYLEKCQTGVAHAALHEIRGKGGEDDK